MHCCGDAWQQLKAVAGKGSFGVVYEATWAGHGTVAVKIPSTFLPPEASQKALKEVLNEFRLHTIIPPHPHVVQLHGCIEVPKEAAAANPLAALGESMPWIVMEFVRGSTVLDAVRAAPLDDITVLDFARQAAAGLGHIHAHRLVHRDVACRNLLLTEDRVLKVSDFGFAREVSDKYALAATKSVIGACEVAGEAPQTFLCSAVTTFCFYRYPIPLPSPLPRNQPPAPGLYYLLLLSRWSL